MPEVGRDKLAIVHHDLGLIHKDTSMYKDHYHAHHQKLILSHNALWVLYLKSTHHVYLIEELLDCDHAL